MTFTARITLGYLVIVGLGAYFLLNVAMDELKPMVRQSMEDTLIETANILATIVKDDVKANRVASSAFAQSLDEAGKRAFGAQIGGVTKDHPNHRIYITDEKGIVIFDTDKKDVGKDYSQWRDVYLTLRGKYGARSTRTDPYDKLSSVMHVAAPIKDGGRIIGVLTVAKPNRSMQPFLDRGKQELLRGGFVLLVISLAFGLLWFFWLTRSLRKLADYATDVSQGKRVTLPNVVGTELIELSRAVETMRTKLEGKEYVEQYVHTLTHELKSPIAAIQGAAELLDEHMMPEQRAKFISNIRSETDRMQTIVERMLELAVVERRQALRKVEPIRVRDLLQEIVERKSGQMMAKGLRVQNDIAQSLVLRGERFLLEQAFMNLLDNAIAFTPPGGHLAFCGSANETSYRISLRDTGTGVPDYALGRVFERFYSLPRPDSGKKGTGIGLSFVQEVALLHQGSATVENHPEGGTIATLSLPRV